MNKTELIEEVQKALGGDTSKAVAGRALDAVIESIKGGLTKGDKKVQLIGFGTFSVSHREAREGVKPGTKEKMKFPATNVVKFKPGAKLKDAVN